LPKKTPAPLVMHWGGIDNWKEERHTFAERFVKEGWSCLVLDSPGTGECPMSRPPMPIRYVAARLYAGRREIIATESRWSAPAGGYWAASWPMSNRNVCAVVNWGGGIHSFARVQERSHDTDSCFDLIEARASLSARRRWTS
jgi:hypothetical protein